MMIGSVASFTQRVLRFPKPICGVSANRPWCFASNSATSCRMSSIHFVSVSFGLFIRMHSY